MSDTKTALDTFMTSWEDFKKTNDEAIKAKADGKGVADLTEKLDKMEKSFDSFEAKKAAEARAEANSKAMSEMAAQLVELQTAVARGDRGAGGTVKSEAEKFEETYVPAFERYVRKGKDEIDLETKKILETKIIQAGQDNMGGFYLAPSEMERTILKQVVELSPIRSIARVTQIGTKSLLIPKKTGTFAAVRTTELGTRSETEGYRTGMVEIFAPEMYADVRISQQMLEDSMFNMEQELSEEISEQFAVREGYEFINGGGQAVLEMEGLLTNGDIPYKASGSAAVLADANGVADGIIDAFYGVKTAYSRNGSFIMNRRTLAEARKLKDAQKQYIWQPGLSNGIPNTILGAPYLEVPDMPDIAANSYPIIFGDFNRGYRIVDRIGLSVLRDPYTVAANGQIKFLARKRVGGAVTMPEALIKVKIAVS